MSLAHGNRPIVTDGLVLCLDAANTRSYSGTGTDWFDLSGNGNHGTLVNGVGYSADNKGSLVFDGTNQEISGTNLSSVISNEFTLETWIKTPSFNNNIRGLFQISRFLGTFLWTDNSFSVQSNGDNAGASALTQVNVDAWYQLVGIFVGGIRYDMYMNGAFIRTEATTDTEAITEDYTRRSVIYDTNPPKWDK